MSPETLQVLEKIKYILRKEINESQKETLRWIRQYNKQDPWFSGLRIGKHDAIRIINNIIGEGNEQ